MMDRFAARHDVGAIRNTTYDGYKRHPENHFVPTLGGMKTAGLGDNQSQLVMGQAREVRSARWERRVEPSNDPDLQSPDLPDAR